MPSQLALPEKEAHALPSPPKEGPEGGTLFSSVEPKVTSRNDPARDERYGCAEAIFNWSKKNSLMDDSAGEMEVTYTPEICNGPCARVMKP